MKLEKVFLPLMVFAAVITVYLLFRKSGGVPSALTPNTSSSGVPATYSNSGVVQPATYNVPPIVPLGNPNLISLNPSSNSPTSQNGDTSVPAYLTYNMSPGNDLNKQPTYDISKQSTCGCSGCKQTTCNTCKSAYSFTDGTTKLSPSKSKLIRNAPDSQLRRLNANLIDYANTESSSTIPTLTSTQASGSLEGEPTLGTPYTWIQ